MTHKHTSTQIIKDAINWAIRQGYHPFSSAVSAEEKNNILLNACNSHEDLLSSVQLNCLIPATNEKDQLILEQFAERRGWKKDMPIEQFVQSYNRSALAKATS